MKAALFLAAAGIVAAQNFGDEPQCARGCLQSGIPAAGCDLNDQACQCGPKQTDIVAKVAPCLIQSCSPADVISASSVGLALCSAFSASQKSGTATATATTTGSGAGGPTTTSFSMSPPPSSGQTIGAGSTTSTSTVKGGTATTKVPTTTASTSTPNAAATPIALGLGGLAALVGAMAAL